MTPTVQQINELVESAVARRGLDARRCYASVSALPPDGARLVVECSDDGVLEELSGRLPDGVELRRLPDPAASPDGALIAVSSVVDVRREPSHAAELVSQVVYGDEVALLREQGEWMLVRLDDGYIGWIRSWHLATVPRAEFERFAVLSRHRVAANHAPVLSEPTPGALPVADLVVGTLVRASADGPRGWRSVTLPDGKTGFVRSRSLERLPAAGPADRLALSATAVRFLGIPYLWGGTTPNGFDCSGLVQRVFRLNGIVLPRDSDLQAGVGTAREGAPAGLEPGDLMFFGAEGGPITHVAIVLPGGLFVHAYGHVRIGSLDPGHPHYESKLHKIYRLSRNPLGAGA